jgi:hypothetical protein
MLETEQFVLTLFVFLAFVTITLGGWLVTLALIGRWFVDRALNTTLGTRIGRVLWSMGTGLFLIGVLFAARAIKGVGSQPPIDPYWLYAAILMAMLAAFAWATIWALTCGPPLVGALAEGIRNRFGGAGLPKRGGRKQRRWQERIADQQGIQDVRQEAQDTRQEAQDVRQVTQDARDNGGG